MKQVSYACLPATQMVKRFQDNCIVERDKIWMRLYGCTGQFNSSIHLSWLLFSMEISMRWRLRPVVLPLMRTCIHLSRGTFLHRNARAHTAHLTQNFLQANDTYVMEWPAMSADISPTEYYISGIN